MIPAEIRLPGVVRSAELVAGRRGSQVWRLVMSDGLGLALKYTTDDGEAMQQQAPQLAAREAAVLAILSPESVYASGATSAGSWLAATWTRGESLSQPWRRLRREPGPTKRTAALTATVSAAQAVAALHARGWRHADLQADHILIDDGAPARLVDLALAQGPSPVVPEVTYRGALAHLTAPEIASEISATPASHHVTLTEAAEVYMFGAVVFVAWSGVWPSYYGTDDSRRLTVAEIHERIGDPRSLRPMPDGWPELAAVLSAILAPASGERPTMAEVVGALRSVAGGP